MPQAPACVGRKMTHFSSEEFQRKYNDRVMSEEQVGTGTLSVNGVVGCLGSGND